MTTVRTGAEVIADIEAKVERAVTTAEQALATAQRIETKLDQIMETVSSAVEAVNQIAESGLGGLLSGGFGSLFGK